MTAAPSQYTASCLSCCAEAPNRYQLRSTLPLNQPLCEQLLGSICAPLVFFFGVAEKLREILVIVLLGIAYVLVVSLSTLQRIIENANKIVGYICRTGAPGRSLSHSFLLSPKVKSNPDCDSPIENSYLYFRSMYRTFVVQSLAYECRVRRSTGKINAFSPNRSVLAEQRVVKYK